MSGKPEKPASIIPPLTALTDEARTRALARFRLLQPCVEDGVPLERLARQQGMALRTAQRWLQRYRQRGLAGRVPRHGPTVGTIAASPLNSSS
jgi:transposase-like protein